MFCMGCGAEVPPHATVCAVCGRATGHGGEVRTAHPAAGVPEPTEATGSPSASRQRAGPSTLASTPLVAPRPSIGSGDLDHAGFPRDALGRALIFIVLAMAADLLAPWANLGGNRVAPSSLGLLAAVGVVWLALAGLPLLHSSLRATPLYAAAPLVVGATCLGVGAAVWVRVTLLDTQSFTYGQLTPSDIPGYHGLQPLTPTSNSADVGLYLFLAGAIVLIVVGYQLFLAAARAQARAEMRAETAVASNQRAASPVVSASLTQHIVSDGQSPLDGAAAAATGSISRPLPPPPTPAPVALQVPPATADTRPGVALPGSPAWSQTPTTPDFQRPSPSLGWRHRGP